MTSPTKKIEKIEKEKNGGDFSLRPESSRHSTDRNEEDPLSDGQTEKTYPTDLTDTLTSCSMLAVKIADLCCNVFPPINS